VGCGDVEEDPGIIVIGEAILSLSDSSLGWGGIGVATFASASVVFGAFLDTTFAVVRSRLNGVGFVIAAVL